MDKYQVVFYQTENGDAPARMFLDSLGLKMRAKMVRGIQLLQESGPKLREPFSKPIGDGIFELRAVQGSDQMRILYFFFVGKKIVFLNGFIKKTKKTPKLEIKLAQKYKKEYEEKNKI